MSDINNLIEDLTKELEPVKPQAHPMLRVLPWFVIAPLYVFVIVQIIGPRPDLSMMLADLNFLMEVVLMAGLAVSGGIASYFLSIPDMRGQKWLLGVPFTILGIFMLWCFLRGAVEGPAIPQLHWDPCIHEGIFMALVPMAVLMFMLRKGATTKPVFMTSMNIMAVGALASIGLRMTCIIDTVGHIVMYKVMPFALIGLMIGVFARRIFKW